MKNMRLPSLAFACFLFYNYILITLSQFTSFSLSSVLCHQHERLALMQFKQSFIIVKPAPVAHSKVDKWEFEAVVDDCCSWDGIECDRTGHITALDLSSSFLYGSINSSSTLFHLVHLQNLNLAYNDFNYSAIPSALGKLSMLTYLNLSNSVFSGQVPSQISKLFRLTSLDLSNNRDPYSFQNQGLLELKSPDLKSLIQNLTNLKYVDLSYVDVASPVPSVLANFSSLTVLTLDSCGLLGKFPSPIFQLPNLETVWLGNNSGLTGNFPEFMNFNSQLKVMVLFNTSFSGELPASIGNLNSLELLGIGHCNFSGLVPSTLGNLPKLQILDLGYNFFKGSVPSTLGNLTSLYRMDLQNNDFTGLASAMFGNLTMLMSLNLGYNSFGGELPASIGNLTSLEHLIVSSCDFTGLVPAMLGNLTKLQVLDLGSNYFTGSIPSQLTNLTQLTYLNLMANMLEGSVPSSISRLKKLEAFDCDENRLGGFLELDTIFLELKHLKYLSLSLNDFYLVTGNNSNATSSPQLIYIGLRWCHLGGFPDFLRNQQELQLLDLSSNNIQGNIPSWMSKVSTETLSFLDLSNNSLTGFDEFPVVLPWSNLDYLKLDSNILQGFLPVPPFSTTFYSIKNNSLTGEIPQLLCNLSYLSILDFSHNNLSGEIPLSLSNFSNSLLVLNMRANNFDGPIPHGWASGNSLKMIDFGKNKLVGKIPRSLMECRMLEYLDLGKNQISDAFPSWLGTLPELNILILCSNALYGRIGNPETTLDFVFPKLRIIDLSDNRFHGRLPSGYFKRWNAMRSLDVGNSKTYYYVSENLDMMISVINVPRDYYFSMTITNKGMQMEYQKITRALAAIDLSGNRFDGEIPESIGSLKELLLVNLSNNNLVGRIPTAIAKLTNVEALDLSQNNLSGRIPWELSTQLTFLAVLNLSHNSLTGRIPQKQQFSTFEMSCFDGNAGLCGKPLPKKCDDSASSGPPSPCSTTSEDSALLDWEIVVLGYGSGFLIGVVIGHFVTKWKHDWFTNTFYKTPARRRTRHRTRTKTSTR